MMKCELCDKIVTELKTLVVISSRGYVGSGLGVKKCCEECYNKHPDGYIRHEYK